jgi:hypothetical protein
MRLDRRRFLAALGASGVLAGREARGESRPMRFVGF